MPTPIDFKSIRGETPEGQRSFFEQLICHLARLDGGGGDFRRIEGAGGDGGVEALRILPTGGKVGYQAKYHPERDKIDWKKIDDSVTTALAQHPDLERYIIAIPCDFTGRRAARGGSTEGVWGKWDSSVTKWSGFAAARQMSVQFEPLNTRDRPRFPRCRGRVGRARPARSRSDARVWSQSVRFAPTRRTLCAALPGTLRELSTLLPELRRLIEV